MAMFLRFKRAKGHTCVLLVRNLWIDGKTVQRTVRNFGRHDRLDREDLDRELATMPGFDFLAR